MLAPARGADQWQYTKVTRPIFHWYMTIRYTLLFSCPAAASRTRSPQRWLLDAHLQRRHTAPRLVACERWVLELKCECPQYPAIPREERTAPRCVLHTCILPMRSSCANTLSARCHEEGVVGALGQKRTNVKLRLGSVQSTHGLHAHNLLHRVLKASEDRQRGGYYVWQRLEQDVRA